MDTNTLMAAIADPHVVETFNAKVDRREPSDCWPWLGCQAGTSIYFRGETFNAPPRRLAWIFAHGPIVGGRHKKVIRCSRTKSCVNPAHLRLGTAWDASRAYHDRINGL